MPLYWDPIVAMDRILADPPPGHAAPWTALGWNSRDAIFAESWAERDWRNVPGPFYAAETDTCGGGRWCAPDLILVNEHWTEFVFRQPTNSTQVIGLLDAAYDDPFQEYGCDGNDHWTLEAIRAWWADRDRLLQWIESMVQMMTEQKAVGEVASLREYAADIRGPLERQLREYAYWIDNGAPAQPADRLPSL